MNFMNIDYKFIKHFPLNLTLNKGTIKYILISIDQTLCSCLNWLFERTSKPVFTGIQLNHCQKFNPTEFPRILNLIPSLPKLYPHPSNSALKIPQW